MTGLSVTRMVWTTHAMPNNDSDLDHSELKSSLSYDENTGIFRWLVRPSSKVMPGTVAGTMKRGYSSIQIFGRRYLAHRLAWFYHHGEWPAGEIDHADRNPSNNAISNLRISTRSQNNHNKDVLGYSLCSRTGKYQSVININGAFVKLGLFNTKEEAAAAYRGASIAHFREFSPFHRREV
jgi:hypothetical protein